MAWPSLAIGQTVGPCSGRLKSHTRRLTLPRIGSDAGARRHHGGNRRDADIDRNVLTRAAPDRCRDRYRRARGSRHGRTPREFRRSAGCRGSGRLRKSSLPLNVRVERSRDTLALGVSTSLTRTERVSGVCRRDATMTPGVRRRRRRELRPCRKARSTWRPSRTCAQARHRWP